MQFLKWNRFKNNEKPELNKVMDRLFTIPKRDIRAKVEGTRWRVDEKLQHPLNQASTRQQSQSSLKSNKTKRWRKQRQSNDYQESALGKDI